MPLTRIVWAKGVISPIDSPVNIRPLTAEEIAELPAGIDSSLFGVSTENPLSQGNETNPIQESHSATRNGN